ncbi:hypothetical protein LJR231_001954 [Phyllobacterium sp. LjRoot231]|uniref:hypothetical protein n=1 Tax=Phyllobacterium sp. LjRoot231 TaxID=3342289 RepID=UPI003ECFC9BC
MQIINDADQAAQKLNVEIETLEHLLRDLKRLRSGNFPDKKELATAPLIDQWSVGTRPLPCLYGVISGHPRFRTSEGVTSDVWVMSPNLKFVRTLSRYYRLGVRAETG